MDALSEQQRGILRESLLALVAELRSLVESSAPGARPVALDQPIGRVSRIDAIQQQSMVVANRRAMSLRLRQAESALHRFEQDEYGLCVSCGEEVGFERLRVRPEAPFCIGCQSRREQRE